jgi:DNA polymerase III subunit delta
MASLKPESLNAALERGWQRVYTLHGDETLLVQEAADAIRRKARQAGFGERHVFTVSGAHFDWGAVLAATQSMSLFADKLIVDIRIPSGKPGKEGSAALQRLCESLSDDVLVLIQLPKLDGQQIKSGWYAALESSGTTVRIDPVERAALPAWLAKRMATHGQRVADGVEGEQSLAFIADRVEGNLLAAHQEVAKLALLHPAGVLALADIQASVLNVARFDVTKLSEAVLAGQVDRALRVLQGLQAEGESAVFVHWTLASDLLSLKRAREALDQGRPMPLALQEARIWGVKQRLMERVLPQLSSRQAAHWVEAARDCDGVIKGLSAPGWPEDAWPALRLLVLKVLDVTRSTGGKSGSKPLQRLACGGQPNLVTAAG